MNTVHKIQAALQGMTREERADFRAWYAEFDSDEWDRQIEGDVAAGRLDWLIAEARNDNRQGHCTDR